MRVGDIAGSSEWSECLNVDGENTRPSTQVHGPVSMFSSDEVMEPLICLRRLGFVWVLMNFFFAFGTAVLVCVSYRCQLGGRCCNFAAH